MKMDRSSVQTLWIYILYIVLITAKGKCSEYEVCAIAGFNATLQWELNVTGYLAMSSTIHIFNESGIKIAEVLDEVCENVEDSSIYCEKWNHTEKWFLKMVLINVKPANTGRYTIQIAPGAENERNITKELIVIVSSTAASSPEHNKDPQLGLIALGLVIVAVFLVIAGILMIRKLRYYRNVKLGSRTFHQAWAEQVNNEACENILSFEDPNRPLPIPPNQENARRSAVKSNYPNIHQKSKSLQKLLDCTKDNCTPVRKSLSLQTLIQLSETIGRPTNSDDSVINMCSSKKDSWSSMEGSDRGIRLMEMHSKDRKDKKITSVEQYTGANSHSLNNPLRGKFEQEDLCNTKDEAAWLVYDYARASELEEHLREDSMTIEAENYHYDYAILPGV